MNRTRIIFSALLLLFIPIVGSTARAQEEQTIRTDNLDESYKQVLNLLFPFPQKAIKLDGREYAMVLRYTPSFDAESQIVIVCRNGRVEVTEYASLDGNIYYKLEKMLKRMEPDPAKLAKRIRVRKRTLTIPLSEAQRWRSDLIASAKMGLAEEQRASAIPHTSVDVTADGTSYEIWDSSASGEVYYSPSNIEISNQDYPGKRSFIRQMETIRRDVINMGQARFSRRQATN